MLSCVFIQQEKNELKRELWRIEDVMGGLSASKANYKITVDSIQNPGEICLFADDDVICNETRETVEEKLRCALERRVGRRKTHVCE